MENLTSQQFYKLNNKCLRAIASLLTGGGIDHRYVLLDEYGADRYLKTLDLVRTPTESILAGMQDDTSVLLKDSNDAIKTCVQHIAETIIFAEIVSDRSIKFGECELVHAVKMVKQALSITESYNDVRCSTLEDESTHLATTIFFYILKHKLYANNKLTCDDMRYIDRLFVELCQDMPDDVTKMCRTIYESYTFYGLILAVITNVINKQ